MDKIVNQSWSKICLDFFKGITVILTGMPAAEVIGFAICTLYIKIRIYKSEKIFYKYSKDVGTMRDITNIIFDKSD